MSERLTPAYEGLAKSLDDDEDAELEGLPLPRFSLFNSYLSMSCRSRPNCNLLAASKALKILKCIY